MDLRLTRPFRLLLDELGNADRYETHRVHDYFVGGTHDERKVNVIVRVDVDRGLCLVKPLAELLKARGVNASFYYLTNPTRYYDLWDSETPKRTAELGFEVGLHTDHFYEELTGQGPALERIRQDLARLSSLIGRDVRGMVYHGHDEINRLGQCNWQPYKLLPPEQLGLAYHDGLLSPYTEMKHLGGWAPATKYSVSDYLVVPGGIRYRPRHLVRALRAAKRGRSVHVVLHPLNVFENWEDAWTADGGERKRGRPAFGLATYLKVNSPFWARAATGPWRGLCRLPYKLLPLAHWLYHRPPEEKPDTSREYEVEALYEKGIEHFEQSLANWGLVPAERALEVGFGAGQWLVALSRHCEEVYGVEPQNLGLRLTLERLQEFGCQNVHLEQAFAKKLPYEDERFDLLLCYGVLMYCRPERSFREFRRVLRPGGRIFISVDGLGYFLRQMRDGLAFHNSSRFKFGLRAIRHTLWRRRILRRDTRSTCYFSHHDMARLFERHGFELTQLAPEPIRWGTTFAGQPVFFRCIGHKK